MLYTTVKKYNQIFDGIPVAFVTLKIHLITMKLKAKVEMKSGIVFHLESVPSEENHQFEERIENEVYHRYSH